MVSMGITPSLKMNLLGKIIFVYMLHYATATSLPSMDRTYITTTTWNQSLLMTMKWIPQPLNRELFYDILLGENNHSIAALHWNSPVDGVLGGYNLTLFTHNFKEGFSAPPAPCLIPVGDGIESLFPVTVVALRIDRVLVYFKKNHKSKGSMHIPQVINPETCEIMGDTNIDSYVGSSPISIVPFKNTFDVIFFNQTVCPDDWWCKMTFDHDGKKLSEPTPLFKDKQDIMYVNRIYPMSYESGKEGHVVVTKKKGYPATGPSVYSPVRGWVSAEDLKEDNHFYSNTSGYASICWQTKDLKNIECLRLDGAQKDEPMTIKLDDRTMQMPYIHHSPKGKIILLKEGLNDGKKVVFSDTAKADGKCKRYMITEFTNELKRIELSVVDDETSCISLVTKDPNPVSQKVYSFIYSYTFQTTCVKYPKDFVAAEITCGKDYIFS